MRLRPSPRRLWRLLESPLVAGVFGEPVIDFYGGLLGRGLTARRVFARVEAVRDEASGVKSFVLRPNGHFRGFRAGQHVNVTIEIGGVRQTRCYSPSNAPDDEGTVVLTVKRHPGGRVSGFLCDRVRARDWVELGPAFGDFTLSDDSRRKTLFVAGGSGITPIASLVREIAGRGGDQDVVLLAYGRRYEDLIFSKELRALEREHANLRVHFAVTREHALTRDLAGRFAPGHVERVAPDVARRQIFVCGPRTLIDAVRSFCSERGLPNPKMETFAPLEAFTLPNGGALATVEITAARSRRRFSAATGASLLVQAERAGLSPASGCRQGICFTCACRKRSGVVRNLSTGAVSSEPDEEIRLCISEPLSDVTLEL